MMAIHTAPRVQGKKVAKTRPMRRVRRGDSKVPALRVLTPYQLGLKIRLPRFHRRAPMDPPLLKLLRNPRLLKLKEMAVKKGFGREMNLAILKGHADTFSSAIQKGHGVQMAFAIRNDLVAKMVPLLRKGFSRELAIAIKGGFGSEMVVVLEKGYGSQMKLAIQNGYGREMALILQKGILNTSRKRQ